MHIDADHMYHGAASTQIAEPREFTASNRLENTTARGAFRINASIGVYMKHASKPVPGRIGGVPEYAFTFSAKNLAEWDAPKPHCTKLFIVMACVAAKQICCIEMQEFGDHIERRRHYAGRAESQYQVLVAVPSDKSFRVYTNAPGKKGLSLKQQIVSRNRSWRDLHLT